MRQVAAGSIAGALVVGLSASIAIGQQVQPGRPGVCTVGSLAQVQGTFERFAERGGTIIVSARGAIQATCPRVVGILYTGARALMADCKPGMRFSTGGSLRSLASGELIVDAPAIVCTPAAPPELNPEPRVNPR